MSSVTLERWFELKVVQLGFYHLAGLICHEDETRLLWLFTDEASLSIAVDSWIALSAAEPEEGDNKWKGLELSFSSY